MALNIHTDPDFEKKLQWLSKRSHKTKTAIVKELVEESYQLKKSGFQKGAFQHLFPDPENIQKELKEMDDDDDLD